LIFFAGLIVLGLMINAGLKERGLWPYATESTALPAELPLDTEGGCYSSHVLPDPNDVAARLILPAVGAPSGIGYNALWQVRQPGNDIWLKISIDNGESFVFADLICGYWPKGEERGVMQLRFGEFILTRGTPEPSA
jgi:hypothetical protein